MRAQDCPVCHAKAAYAAKTPYCPRCGWHRQQAESQLRLNLRVAPAIFLLLLCVLLLLFFHGGGRQNKILIAVILSFPVIAFLASYIVTRRNLRRLLALPVSSFQPAETPVESAPALQPSATLPQYVTLLKTSPPRKVRMTRRGKFHLSLTLIIVLLFFSIMVSALYSAWSATHSFAGFHLREWGFAAFAVVLLLLLLSQWRTMARERGLLRDGDIVPAKIVQKWTSRSASTVSYEFQDASGRKHRHAGMDYTGKCEEGMTVPVFYDRENPSSQVAACGVSHEVVLPDSPSR